jgi:acetyl esterase/lipase
MWILRLLTAVMGLFGQGRSPAVMLNLTVPRSGYRLHRDLAYGTGRRHRFDLYLPLAVSSPAPVVLFFYGGAFRVGRKDEYRVVGQALASKGIIVAVADYRLYPQARFPDFLDDGAKAFAAVRGSVAEFGGDPDRIFIAGHSAGAYIAAMLAANPEYLRKVNLELSAIRGVIPIAGRFHEMPVGDPIVVETFRGPARPETRPATFIDSKRPPMMLVAGAAESPEVLESHKKLAAHLRAQGSEVEEITYPHIGHMGIMLALAPGFRHRARLREDIARFVRAH